MKNNIHKRSLLISLLCIFQVYAHDTTPPIDAHKYPEFARFAQRYACPKDIAEKVKKITTSCFYEGENFYVKGQDIDRLINALRAKRIIEHNHLDHIAVADKCLCQNGYGDFLVAARKIRSVQGRRLSLKDTQDLITFVEETGFRDWLALDLINDQKNDKLTFVDTENGSFLVGIVHGNKEENIPQHCKLVYLACLAKSLGKFMEKDAVDFCNQRFNQLFNSPEGTQPHTPIFGNTKYDDSDIDFEKVKEEFQEFLSEKN